MDTCIHTILNGNKLLIVCFGGINLKFGGIPPLDFLNYLSTIYHNVDFIFFVDLDKCIYQKGIQGITKNIDETVLYLNGIIKHGNYDKVLFMGTSTGGYASILFGSLCHVNNVISFVPYTILKNSIDSMYSNLKHIINDTTFYVIYGDTCIANPICTEYILHQHTSSTLPCTLCNSHYRICRLDVNCRHHITHCDNISHFRNVYVIRNKGYDMNQLIESGLLKNI